MVERSILPKRDLLFCGGWLQREELGLVGLHGVQESVPVGGAGGGDFAQDEVEFAGGVQSVSLD